MMRNTLSNALALTVAASLFGSLGCAGKAKPAAEPMRPKAKKAKKQKEVPTDCRAVTVADESPAVPYKERSVPEAQNLAKEGFDMLRAAEARGVAKSERQRMIRESVDKFITALRADPYNVHATYNLAAAYARIDRFQCAINLLARLELLRRLPSQTDRVEAKLDRLLGRGRYKGRLDPDFNPMRDDARFRELVKKLQ